MPSSEKHNPPDLDPYLRGNGVSPYGRTSSWQDLDTSTHLGLSHGNGSRKASAKLGGKDAAPKNPQYGSELRVMSPSRLQARNLPRIQRRSDRRKKPQAPMLTIAQLRERARQQSPALLRSGQQDRHEEQDGQEGRQAPQDGQNRETSGPRGRDGSSQVELKDTEKSGHRREEGGGSKWKAQSSSSAEEQDTSSSRSHSSSREGSESSKSSDREWKYLREGGEKSTANQIHLPMTSK